MNGLIGLAQFFTTGCLIVLVIKAGLDSLGGKASAEPWLKVAWIAVAAGFALSIVVDFAVGAPTGTPLRTILNVIPEMIEAVASAASAAIKPKPDAPLFGR